MEMLRRIKNAILDLRIIYKEIFRTKSYFGVPFFTRLKMNLRGFTADQYVRYDLKNNDISEYISEFERWKTRRVNGRYNLVLDDKLVFPEVFGKYVHVPKNLGWIKKGRIFDFQGGCFSAQGFLEQLAALGALVLKPVYAQGSGKGVHVVKQVEGGCTWDGTAISPQAVLERLKKFDDYILTEFVEQHRYAGELYPETTNTIRIITIIDSSAGTASITNAVQRIGVKASIPVDNGKKGALVAQIDLATGKLGEAKTFYSTERHQKHPETGAPIVGVQIPFWEKVKAEVVNVAQRFPYIYFMAWDIVITEQGFSVLEINTSSGLNLFQMWQGLRNAELGRFYRQHKIIK